MDFNGPITEEQLAEIEEAANDAVEQNLPVQVSYPDRDELETLDYRSKKEISGQIRIVTIPGVDVCACCGTHVSATGEVRLIKLLSVQNYKGGRCGLPCCAGRTPSRTIREKHAWITEAMHLLSAKPENVCGRNPEAPGGNPRAEGTAHGNAEKAGKGTAGRDCGGYGVCMPAGRRFW